MKSRRRSGARLGLAIAVAAVVVTGWIVLSGRVDWLARFAEPRIGQALRDAGIEADSLDFALLSIEGGRIEHARMRFKGGDVEIQGLEVAIGVGNVVSRRVGSITIDRLDLELNGDPIGIKSAEPSDEPDELPFGTVEVKEWTLSTPLGGELVRVTGDLHATPESGGVVKFSGRFTSDEAKGGYSGEYASAKDRFLLRFDDTEVTPAAVVAILRGMPDSAGAGLTVGWDSAVVNGEMVMSAGSPVRASGHVRIENAAAARDGQAASLEKLTADFSWATGTGASIDAEGLRLRANSGEWVGNAESLQFVGGLAGGNIALGRLALSSDDRDIRGHLISSLVIGNDWKLESAEGTFVVGSASVEGFVAGESEIEFLWKDAVLNARTPRLPLTGAVEVVIEEADVSVSDLGMAQPSAGGSAVIVLDTSRLLESGTVVTPARERIPVRFVSFLAPEAESLRVEFDAPDETRSIETRGLKGVAAGGISGVVTLDASHITGSFNGEWWDVSVASGKDRRASFQELQFKWSTGRVWTDAVRAWRESDPERTIRELLWISNLDLRGTGGTLEMGDIGSAFGVSATVVSNGADLSERAGGSLVLAAEDVRSGGRELTDFSASLAFGLDGGSLVADVVHTKPRVRVHFNQSVAWAGSIASSGTFETERVDLATIDLAEAIPAAQGVTASGHIRAMGNTRMGPDGFGGDARLQLEDVGLRWQKEEAAVEGISGEIVLDSLSPLRTRSSQRLTFSDAGVEDLKVSDGVIEFEMPSSELVEVARLEAKTLGGNISASPFAFNPLDPRPASRVRLDGVRLEQLLAFFPDIPARASGPIMGELPVSWDGRQIAFGSGYIDIQPGEIGRIQFDYDVRLLTSSTDRGDVLYGVKREIETSVRDLHFDRLRIDLYPKDVPGRSAQIRLVGVTASDRIHAPVQLDVNIDAPLERFIKFGDNPVKP